MTKRDDGGPFHPNGVDVTRDQFAPHGGASLRDALAVHAPPMPTWFEPLLPPEPPRPDGRLCHDDCGPDDEECRQPDVCGALVEFYHQRSIRNVEASRQALFQWPYAYADGVLAARKEGDDARR